MVEVARLLEVVPVWPVVVVELVAALLSAGLLPKSELVAAAGAAVVVVPDVAVVAAGAAAVLAAGAVVAAGVEPNRPPVAGADVAAGVEVAGFAPNRLLAAAGAGAAEVAAVEAGADEPAVAAKRLLVDVLFPPVAAAKGLAAAVVAGAAAVVAAGFAPKRLDAVAGVALACCDCDVVAEALPKRPPAVEVGAASGFLPKRPPALEVLLSFAAAANSEEPPAAGAAAGVVELVFPNMPPPVDGWAAGVLPNRPPALGACACGCPKGDAAAWVGYEAGCVVVEAVGAPAGVVDPRPPNKPPDGFAGVAWAPAAAPNSELPVLLLLCAFPKRPPGAGAEVAGVDVLLPKRPPDVAVVDVVDTAGAAEDAAAPNGFGDAVALLFPKRPAPFDAAGLAALLKRPPPVAGCCCC